MNNNRFTGLAVLSIEFDLAQELDLEDIIQKICLKKVREVNFLFSTPLKIVNIIIQVNGWGTGPMSPLNTPLRIDIIITKQCELSNVLE